MRLATAFVVSIVCVAVVTGCSNARKSLGWDKKAPDEFTVVSRQPLTIPPEFELAPPNPGAPRPEQGTTRDQAKRVLLTKDNDRSSRPIEAGSDGQVALLRKVGADQIDPDIRRQVDAETSAFAEDDLTLTEKLMFWTGAPQREYGDVVDAEAELQRLKEAQALGEPVTQGETPTIERKPKALLEGIFN